MTPATNPTIRAFAAIALFTLAGCATPFQGKAAYDPPINPADFSTNIDNEMFSLPVGRKLVFEAQTENGTERVVIEIERGTKTILGVATVTYRDRVWLDDRIVEDTRDYLAQDRAGNVWYFGEEVDNYENGQLVNHDGSFIAGVDGAKPGIWIKGAHQVGDSYRQEYYKGEAEDIRDVLAVDQTVTTGLGTFEGCVKMLDWTPLDPESREHKYYCPDVNALVLTQHLVTGKRTELTATP